MEPQPKRGKRSFFKNAATILDQKPLPKPCPECVKEGKLGNIKKKGLCSRHYQRMLRYGDPGIKPKSKSAWS
jgi:hypothetical protein